MFKVLFFLFNQLRLERESAPVDRLEAVETAHVAAQPAFGGAALEVVQKHDLPVDLYSITAARRQLEEIYSGLPPQDALAKEVAKAIRSLDFQIERKRGHKKPSELEVYLERWAKVAERITPRRLGRALRVLQGYKWVRPVTANATTPRGRWSRLSPAILLRHGRRVLQLLFFVATPGEAAPRLAYQRNGKSLVLRVFYPHTRLGHLREEPARPRTHVPAERLSLGWLLMPAAEARRVVQVAAWLRGLEVALGLGFRDLEDLEAAAIAAMAEGPRSMRFRRGQVDWGYVDLAARRAAQQSRIRRVSGLSVPRRQMPLLGKIREALAKGIEDPAAIAEATGLHMAEVVWLLPAALAAGSFEEAPEGVSAFELDYESILLRVAVTNALDGLVGLERLVVEEYMALGPDFLQDWHEAVKSAAPEALTELNRFRKKHGLEKGARAHAGKYWRSAAKHLRQELEGFVTA